MVYDYPLSDRDSNTIKFDPNLKYKFKYKASVRAWSIFIFIGSSVPLLVEILNIFDRRDKGSWPIDLFLGILGSLMVMPIVIAFFIISLETIFETIKIEDNILTQRRWNGTLELKKSEIEEYSIQQNKLNYRGRETIYTFIVFYPYKLTQKKIIRVSDRIEGYDLILSWAKNEIKYIPFEEKNNKILAA